MNCDYCRRPICATWCPLVIATRDNGRPLPPSQPLATEDWARGVLVALGLDETPEHVAIVREALVALHRSANAEGIARARAQVPAVGDKLGQIQPSVDGENAHQDLLVAISTTLADLHADALAVGVERSVGDPQPPAPAIAAKTPV